MTVKTENKKLKLAAYLTIATSAIILAGCSSSPVKQNIEAPSVMEHVIDLHIDQAAQSAANSLDQLAAIEKTLHPEAQKMPFKDIHSPALEQYLSTKWYGSPEPLIRNIAKSIGYHVQIYGKAPPIEPMVKINTTGSVQTAKNILQNVDLQLGTSASISIFPQQHLITMRYLKHVPTV